MSKPVGRILVTNDDGIHATGLKVAIKIAKQLSDDVWVFAPSEEQSGASHSLSLSRPVRLLKKGAKRYAVGGTPTDCVMIATRVVMKDNPPDLIISGVNAGQNIAEDVSYSGTVAGAKEGTVFGIPSIALSQAVTLFYKRKIRFGVAEKHGARIIRQLLKMKWDTGTLMNVNFPDIDPKDKCKTSVTIQGKRDQDIIALEERRDPRNVPYYWYSFQRIMPNPPVQTDLAAIMRGEISITPLQMDHTNISLKRKMDKLLG
ncbi:MAG: 5'/3'-nucleotidase SurE [Alphaproteobacteria bacterium]|nr:5'/3'-nucleotidase SurE [Alphaproteobacteria bacterium]